MSSAISYIAVFLLSTSGGMALEAEGESFPTYDACMLQAEADAKNMVREWDEAEAAGRPRMFESVEVDCVRREVRDVRSR